MAVTEEHLFYPSESLILKQPRRHFRTSVSPIHWQLRSLIGTGSNGVVYYPTGPKNLHLQKLNTNTLENETINVLSFSPRCLVAKNGWVCCGGETGEFTAMLLEPSSTSGNRAGSSNLHINLDLGLDVDARLPLDATSRSDETLLSLLRRHRPASIASSKKFGKERVNCITLWFPSSSPRSEPCAYQSAVAVLANNDKHVTVVELESLGALDEIEYPDCVNRAVLSPDGRLLVAVGDDPYLYVHERTQDVDPAGRRAAAAGRPVYSWRLQRTVHLKSQRKDDRTDHRGSFAACFSNTGTYLAVGTQYGVISIFSTNAFLHPDQDPLLAYFPSSRPTPEHGAVRDVHTPAYGAVREMAFSPGPYDLLAWSEDRGRVGVADLRSGFVSRQILYLDTDDDAIQHLDLHERSAIDPRRLESHHDRNEALVASLANTLDLTAEEARRAATRRLYALDRLDRYHYPLTMDETQVLEALQDHRRRREQRAAAARELLSNSRNQLSGSRSGTRTANATAATTPASATATATGTAATATAVPRLRERLPSERSTVPDWFTGDPRDPLAEYLFSTSETTQRAEATRTREEARRDVSRDLYRELVDRFVRDSDDSTPSGAGSPGPRNGPSINFRNASVRAALRAAAAGEGNGIGSGAGGDLGGAEAGAGASASGSGSRAGGATVRDRLISRLLGGNLQHAGGYSGWSDLEALSSMSSPGGEEGSSISATGTPAAARSGGRDSMAWDSLLSQVAMRTDPRDLGLRSGEMPAPDETAGLSWSDNGSLLYIGAENGIYEFRVNIASRKVIPSITLR